MRYSLSTCNLKFKSSTIFVKINFSSYSKLLHLCFEIRPPNVSEERQRINITQTLGRSKRTGFSFFFFDRNRIKPSTSSQQLSVNDLFVWQTNRCRVYTGIPAPASRFLRDKDRPVRLFINGDAARAALQRHAHLACS